MGAARTWQFLCCTFVLRGTAFNAAQSVFLTLRNAYTRIVKAYVLAQRIVIGFPKSVITTRLLLPVDLETTPREYNKSCFLFLTAGANVCDMYTKQLLRLSNNLRIIRT